MLVKFGFKTYEVIKDFTPIDQDRDVALVTRKNKTANVRKHREERKWLRSATLMKN